MSEIRVVQPRLLNARFVVSLIALVAVLVGSFALAETVRHQAAGDANTKKALAEVAKAQAQVHELIEQIRARDAELRDQAAATQSNTAVFAANQAAMLRFQSVELAWTRRILNFVRTHPGQPIPAAFLIAAPTAPVLRRISTSRKASRHAAKRKHGRARR